MGNMGNYGTKRIGHLVIHSSTQKGNFNFAIKISKKLLAFGINWLLNAYLSLLSLNERIRCQSVSVTQWQSVYLSLKFSVSHLVSWSVLVCLLFVGQSISLSVCQKHATLGFRPCFFSHPLAWASQQKAWASHLESQTRLWNSDIISHKVIYFSE